MYGAPFKSPARKRHPQSLRKPKHSRSFSPYDVGYNAGSGEDSVFEEITPSTASATPSAEGIPYAANMSIIPEHAEETTDGIPLKDLGEEARRPSVKLPPPHLMLKVINLPLF